MRKYVVFLLASLLSFAGFAQVPDSQINTDINQVRTQKSDPIRTALPMQDLANSKVSTLALQASGTNTYVVSNLNGQISAYMTGQTFPVYFQNANTSTATININGAGAKSLVKNGASPLSSGDISAGSLLWIYYDGTNFRVSLQGGGGGSVAWGSITGLMSNQTDLTTGLNSKQGLNSNLSVIGGLAPSNTDFMQYKSGAWTNSNIATVLSDLGIPTDFSVYLQGNGTNTFTTDTDFEGAGHNFNFGTGASRFGSIYVYTSSGANFYSSGYFNVQSDGNVSLSSGNNVGAVVSFNSANGITLTSGGGHQFVMDATGYTFDTKRLLIAGNVTVGSSNFNTTFVTSGNTTVTLPTAGQLSTLSGSETLTNKTINGSNNTITNVSLTTGVTGDLPFSNLAQASAASKLLGRGSASGAGDFQEITLGTGLSLSGTTLNVTAGTIGGVTGATDNRIIRADGTAGSTIQASTATLDDSGNLALPGVLTTPGITFTSFTNGGLLYVDPAGTGGVTHGNTYFINGSGLHSGGSIFTSAYILGETSQTSQYYGITLNQTNSNRGMFVTGFTGTGAFRLDTDTGVRVVGQTSNIELDLYASFAPGLYGTKLGATTAALNIAGATGISGSTAGQDITIQGGFGYGTGNTNGGNINLYAGTPNGSGAPGSIKTFGDLAVSGTGSQNYINISWVNNNIQAVTYAGGTPPSNFSISANGGISGNINGLPAIFRGGNAYSVGNGNGGDATIIGGTANGSGTPGKVFGSYLGVTNNLTNLEQVNETSTARTLTEADRGRIIYIKNAGSTTITLPDGLSTGFTATFWMYESSGTATFTASTTLRTPGSTTQMTTDRESCTCWHEGSNIWNCKGDLH